MDEERVLGIDPGSRVTGLAVVVRGPDGYRVEHCSVLRLSHADHAVRIQEIYREVQALVAAFRPTACAVETPVYGKDPTALLKLGRAQAAAILAAANAGLPVTEYLPKMVKKSITGLGNAGKEQVARMVGHVLRYDHGDLPRDASDALAVAWCHLQRGGAGSVTERDRSTRRRGDAWARFAADNPERIRS